MRAILVIAMTLSGVAHAGIFDDLGEAAVTVTGLRGAVRGLARGAGEGIADGISPLLDRADMILKLRIEDAAKQMLTILKEVEKLLRDLLSAAAELVDQTLTKLDRFIKTNLETIDSFLSQQLCKLLGPGGGIMMELPLLGSAAQINVKRPAKTHCYRDYLAAQTDPADAVFAGWMFYEGELCEAELALREIDPSNPRSIIQIRQAYAEVAARAKLASCKIDDVTKKAANLRKWRQYEAEALFFARLAGEAND